MISSSAKQPASTRCRFGWAHYQSVSPSRASVRITAHGTHPPKAIPDFATHRLLPTTHHPAPQPKTHLIRLSSPKIRGGSTKQNPLKTGHPTAV